MPDEQDKRMSIIEHLEELRWRLIYSLAAFILAFGLAFYFSERILDLVLSPAPLLKTAGGGKLVLLGVTEGFMIQLRVSIYAGLALASPVILYQVAAFTLPALEKKERFYLYTFIPAALGLFLAGVGLAYFVFLPYALKFFGTFGTERIQLLVSAQSFISFVAGFVLPFGLVFELPLVVMLGTYLGLLSPQLLSRYRKYAILVIFIVAAILTPPDVVSQIAMALPLLALYEVSLLLSHLVARRRKT